jgi:hypothetical protein
MGFCRIISIIFHSGKNVVRVGRKGLQTGIGHKQTGSGK